MTYIPSIWISDPIYDSVTILDGAGSANETITADANTVIMFLGSSVDPAFSPGSIIDDLATVVLAGTTVTATRGGSSGDCIVRYVILNLNPLFVKSIQAVSIILAGAATSGDQALTSGSRAWLIPNGWYNTDTSNFAQVVPSMTRIDGSTIRAYKNGNGTGGSSVIKGTLVDLR